MRADGSGVFKLTHPPSGTEDANPDWSPDGARVVFARAPAVGAHSIWTVNADGSGSHRLTPACPPGGGIPSCAADDGWPVWSPDGKHIVLQRLAGALRPKGSTVNTAKEIYKDELVVVDANGEHARTLVWLGPWRGDPQAPAWSPDGKRIVFIGKYMTSKTNGTGCDCRSLYVINDRRQRSAPRPAARASTGWPARLVTRRQNDPLQNPSRRRLQRHRRQPLHDPPRRNRRPPTDAPPVLQSRARRQLLPGRHLDRLRDKQPSDRRRSPRRLRHERRRNQHSTDHPHPELRDRSRLGANTVEGLSKHGQPTYQHPAGNIPAPWGIPRVVSVVKSALVLQDPEQWMTRSP